MLSMEECLSIGLDYVWIIDGIWENEEAYFFDDLRGTWDEDRGVVVYKETGDTVSLYEYFDRKKCREILDLFRLSEHQDY